MPFITIILFGLLSASFALALELLVAGLSSISFVILETVSLQALLVILCIAFIEETSKYLFLRQYASRFFATSGPSLRGALILGASFGIGFAVPELFLIQNGAATPPALALIGTLGLHMATSTAFAASIFSFSEKRFSAFLLLSAAILLHIFYNAAILFFL